MSKDFTVIGLAGLAGSGKDSAADLLVAHCGFTKLAFADPLKNEVAEAFGVEPLYLTRRETKEHAMSCLALRRCLSDGFVARLVIQAQLAGATLDLDAPRSPRQIMQWWGTEYRRHQSQGYWVSQTSARIHYMMMERLATRFVVTDCRFANEAHMVRESYAGRLWQIKRAEVAAAQGGHISETDGSAFRPDVMLHNDHSMRHLQQLVLAEFWAHDAGLAGLKVEIAG